MTKKLIQDLVKISYDKNGILIEQITNTIAQKLSRSNLKKYINAIKQFEKKNTVIITTAGQPSEKDKDSFESIYQNKKIVYNIDPAILLGTQVQDNDIVYNMNLKSRLNNLITYIAK